jgi:aminopeptidase-like protein
MVENVNSAAPPMMQWATDLFPIHRSLTGEGVRETLAYIEHLLPLTVHEVSTGTKAFDWTVPKEWVIREAYVEDAAGNRVIDICNSNLHVLQYSKPFWNRVMRAELDAHLYSLPYQHNAIPYVTSYYKEQWGFCISHRQRQALPDGEYVVKIDSELKDGHITYGELVIPGQEQTEVLLSTNICHPSMANNELSGPVVVTALAQWLASEPRRHTYRILFLPETIGALTYLAVNRPEFVFQGQHRLLGREIIAGYQVVCCGDERTYSYLPSRKGNTLADRAAIKALRGANIYHGANTPDCTIYSYLDRGSDERQWCAPGIDLPVGSIMRSKYDTYPEYHTSLDDLSLISQKGLEGSLAVYKRAIEIIEANRTYKVTTLGEPQLGKRGLYPTESTKDTWAKVQDILNLLAYADGTNDLIAISDIIGVDVMSCAKIAETLREHGLLESK